MKTKIFKGLSKMNKKSPGGNPHYWNEKQKSDYELCRKIGKDMLKLSILSLGQEKTIAELEKLGIKLSKGCGEWVEGVAIKCGEEIAGVISFCEKCSDEAKE